MENEGIVGQCSECGNPVYLDEEFEDLGEGYFVHNGCIPEDVPEEVFR